MELKDKVNNVSDDEEDLESLRLAALQSLKPKQEAPSEPLQNTSFNKQKNFNKPGKGFKNRRNFNGNQGGRNRNFQNGFNNRVRNTNLISITPIEQKEDNEEPSKKPFASSGTTAPKLVLPQDRYCRKNEDEDKGNEVSDKFSRYDNSDESDSESENENDVNQSENDTENNRKLERASSIEKLMEELENEITADVNLLEEVKEMEEKTIKKEEDETKNKEGIGKIGKESTQNEKEMVKSTKNENKIVKSTKNEGKSRSKSPETNKKIELDNIKDKNKLNSNESTNKNNEILNKNEDLITTSKRRNTPELNKNILGEKQRSKTPEKRFLNKQIRSRSRSAERYKHYNENRSRYDQNFHYSNPYPPHFTTAPLYNNYGGLHIDCAPLNDVPPISLAPLSPRSAAFVLQNQEIIERRKKSPRRSYSRSPSPRFRRSASPRFNREFSNSPKRQLGKPKSPVRRFKSRSKSPRNVKNATNRKSPFNKRKSPSNSIKNRLGYPQKTSQDDKKGEDDYSKAEFDNGKKFDSKTDYKNDKFDYKHEKSDYKQEKTNKFDYKSEKADYKHEKTDKFDYKSEKIDFHDKVDYKHEKTDYKHDKFDGRSERSGKADKPEENEVLEARKRKFLSTDIKPEGIIRLKPKTTETKLDNKTEIDEKDNIGEENDEINEDKLLEDELLDDTIDVKVDDLFSDSDSDDENEGRFKTTSKESKGVAVLPFTKLLSSSSDIKVESLENKSVFHRNKRLTDDKLRGRRRSRSPLKIKDDTGKRERHRRVRNDPLLNKKQKSLRKERVTSPIENKKIEIKIRNPSKYEAAKFIEEDDGEVVEGPSRRVEIAKTRNVEEKEPEIIIEDNEEVETPCNDGDLRAQLKRKRAERQKLPILENNQSRILQNALKGAVFKKAKKSKRSKDSPSGKDGKLPIHMRLGVANLHEESDRITRKKLKLKGNLEQSERLSECDRICDELLKAVIRML